MRRPVMPEKLRKFAARKITIAESLVRIIFDRYIHTNEGVNNVAKYLNDHGYVKKIRQNGTIPGFSDHFVKKVIDNPVYMGKIAYGRRRTEKKLGTRNEMHVVEQSEFPVYDGIHEAIISESDWNLAQEKRRKNAYRREKVHDVNHVHLLSGLLRCPDCGKSLYGNIAKAHTKDNKTRYYYYCKNTRGETGHRCSFRTNLEQTEIDRYVAAIISAMVHDKQFEQAIQKKIGTAVNTDDLEREQDAVKDRLRQMLATKTRLENQMDTMDVSDPHYDRKILDLQRRYDDLYDKVAEAEHQIEEIRKQIQTLRSEQISGENVYQLLLAFDELYGEMDEQDKKDLLRAIIERIDLYPEKRPDGNWIRNIVFTFPVPVQGIEVKELPLEKSTLLEMVCLLSKLSGAKHHISVQVDMDELDLTAAESKATYEEIQAWVQERYGFHVTNLNIAQVKRKHGIIERDNYNKPKSEDSRQPGCPEEKSIAIEEAMRHFQMI